MLFNSIDFAVFLPIVFILYWFVTKSSLKVQNLLIVLASYFFYGWWDWRFLTLIILSTVVDFLIGISLEKQENSNKRKILLWTSLLFNLGFLGLLKYYNFFVDSFNTAFSFFGKEIQGNTLDIILPVGISFYTFQTLSYTIDIYQRKLEPTHDLVSFAAFVSFFPQLVAGPIERARNLLPQFCFQRTFDYHKAVDGLKQALWGLFKKVVIADNCAEYANLIFNNSSEYAGSTLVLGAIFFSFQIYADFSGYSDMAIGISRLFGFELMQNFAYPYFSRDIAEFWRRWHISLSTWFRDYLYIPLGGSKKGHWLSIRNIFIIFLVSGFWHGANWTFLAWGGLNALYFLPLLLFKRNRNNLDTVAKGKIFPSVNEVTHIGLTFSLTAFAWIFFRAENISHALKYIAEIFSSSLFTIPAIVPYKIFIIIILFLGIEWVGREQSYATSQLGSNLKPPLRWAMYYGFIFMIFFFTGKQQEFIYFQF